MFFANGIVVYVNTRMRSPNCNRGITYIILISYPFVFVLYFYCYLTINSLRIFFCLIRWYLNCSLSSGECLSLYWVLLVWSALRNYHTQDWTMICASGFDFCANLRWNRLLDCHERLCLRMLQIKTPRLFFSSCWFLSPSDLLTPK